jgi:Cu/Ag efflux pump CusA
VVWSVPTARDSVPDIQNLLIDTPSGQKIRLSDVATVALRPSPNSIDREDGSRHLDILADVDGVDIGTVGEELEDQLDAYDFPRGYSVELLGEFEEQQTAQTRLFTTGAVALAVIVLLLHVALGSWRPAMIAFVTLPIALIGGVFAAFATGGILSIGSLVGFFTVFGIAARNGILLINHAQHLEREEGETFGVDLVLRAARERLSPILMTALTAGLALIPLALGGGEPGNELQTPMAIVILGGLLSATALNMLVLPALYTLYGAVAAPAADRAEEVTGAPTLEPSPW